MMTNSYRYVPVGVVCLVYAGVIGMLAWWASRRTRGVSEYVLGGRHLSGFVTALSAGASDMSSWLLMALPGMVMEKGLGVVWLPCALTLGAYVNWWVVAKRLRVYTEGLGDALTLPSYLGRRFGGEDRVLRGVCGGVMVFFFCWYAVAGFVSAGKVAVLTFGVRYGQGLWWCGLFIVAYTAVGGFLAVSWVDVFQGMLMLVALVVVPWVVYGGLDDFGEGIRALGDKIPSYWDVWHGVSWLGVVSLAAWGMGYVGQPHIVGRFMAIRTVGALPLARRICTVWMGVGMVCAVGVGVVGAVCYREAPLGDPETVFLALSRAFFNGWLHGVLVCAVLSSIMSTVSCLILMAAGSLVEDVLGVWWGDGQGLVGKQRLRWHRLAVCGVSLVALVVASYPRLTIMGSVAFPWCGLGAALGPVVVMSLYWKRMTGKGAMAGMLSGGAFVVVWEVLGAMGNGYVNHPSLLPGFCLLPAFGVSIMAIVGVSRGSSAPSQAVMEHFGAMEEQVKGVR